MSLSILLLCFSLVLVLSLVRSCSARAPTLLYFCFVIAFFLLGSCSVLALFLWCSCCVLALLLILSCFALPRLFFRVWSLLCCFRSAFYLFLLCACSVLALFLLCACVVLALGLSCVRFVLVSCPLSSHAGAQCFASCQRLPRDRRDSAAPLPPLPERIAGARRRREGKTACSRAVAHAGECVADQIALRATE